LIIERSFLFLGKGCSDCQPIFNKENLRLSIQRCMHFISI